MLLFPLRYKFFKGLLTFLKEKGDLVKTQKKKEIENKILYARQTDGHKNAKEIIEKDKQNFNNIDNYIKQEIEGQTNSIMQRLEQRKRNQAQRTTSLPPQKPKNENEASNHSNLFINVLIFFL
jgi:DNA-binding PadR family transcriptional regulator